MSISKWAGFVTIVVGIIGVLAMVWLSFPTEFNERSITTNLPALATDVSSHGNNWFSFRLGDRVFLYKCSKGVYHTSETITELQQYER